MASVLSRHWHIDASNTAGKPEKSISMGYLFFVVNHIGLLKQSLQTGDVWAPSQNVAIRHYTKLLVGGSSHFV